MGGEDDMTYLCVVSYLEELNADLRYRIIPTIKLYVSLGDIL